jgi:hypothetical protein
MEKSQVAGAVDGGRDNCTYVAGDGDNCSRFEQQVPNAVPCARGEAPERLSQPRRVTVKIPIFIGSGNSDPQSDL